MITMLDKYKQDPENPAINFYLGYEYELSEQTAAASSFYLRAAERTNNIDLQYESLLRNVICYIKLKDRDTTVKYQLLRAIQICPKRPEGYFLLSRHYEQSKQYHDGYFTSSIGLSNCNFENNVNFVTDIDYPGICGLFFEKAVCGWWIGNFEESRELMYDLYVNFNTPPNIKASLLKNIVSIGTPSRFSNTYYKSQNAISKYKFENMNLVERNYSQVYQDMFVLSKLNGKFNGYYLEVGSNDPFVNNNTYLLESKFNWKGISIDIDSNMVDRFNFNRKNLCFCKNAVYVNYDQLLSEISFPLNIDYLSVDCDPSEISFKILKKIITSNYTFNVVTFEHDYYVNNNSVREESRIFMKDNGYVLSEQDVCFEGDKSFEDWYIHQSLL